MVSDEEQKVIEAAFMASWDGIEQFYSGEIFTIRWRWIRNILPLIQIFRERGYDRQLHAGTSMFTFMVSRSREYGLRRDQPFLAFDMLEDGGMRVTFEAHNVFVTFDVYRVEITPEIENLLIPLLAYPID